MIKRSLTLVIALATWPGMARAQVFDSATEAHIRRFGNSGLYGIPRRDSVDAMQFVRALQAAVARGDRRAVSRMALYPFHAWDGRQYRVIHGAAEMVRVYPRIFSPGLRRDVAAVTIDSLFANWQGVMFANGRVWFDRPADGGPYRISTINPPTPRRRE